MEGINSEDIMYWICQALCMPYKEHSKHSRPLDPLFWASWGQGSYQMDHCLYPKGLHMVGTQPIPVAQTNSSFAPATHTYQNMGCAFGRPKERPNIWLFSPAHLPDTHSPPPQMHSWLHKSWSSPSPSCPAEAQRASKPRKTHFKVSLRWSWKVST